LYNLVFPQDLPVQADFFLIRSLYAMSERSKESEKWKVTSINSIRKIECAFNLQFFEHPVDNRNPLHVTLMGSQDLHAGT
jgi:hypothetical protein